MDPTPYYIMGLASGIGLTLMINWIANRRAARAIASVKAQDATVPVVDMLLQREHQEMSRRLAVLEQIITDQPRRIAAEIEQLR